MSSLYACLRSPRTPDLAVAVAQEFSPRLQRYGSDGVVLDVGGLGRLFGAPQAIGEALASRIADLCHGTRITDLSHGTRITRITKSSDGTQITRIVGSASVEKGLEGSAKSASREQDPRCAFSVAVAPTQVGAMLLSFEYPGLTVAAEDVASALAPVRLAILRQVFSEIHGDTKLHEDPWRSASRENNPRCASRENDLSRSASRENDPRFEFEVLQRWGLTTLGEMAALPAGALSARLGQPGIVLQRMARGVDASPLVPDPDVPRFLERVELEWPIDGLEPLAFVLARLLDPLSAALERADRGAAALHFHLRLVDRTEHTRVLQLPAAMRDPKVLRTLLVLDLESHPPQAAIDIITIEVDPAPGRVLQYSLLERARPSDETLATLIARLGALAGESRVGQPVLLDSHRPDAFEMRRFAPDERVRPDHPVSRPDDPTASAFRRNDALENGVLRRFRPPIAIRVQVERGRPRHVFIDRRGMPGGRVGQCAGPWRSSGSWWKEWGEARRGLPGGAIRPWHRDEWDVALGDGSVCRLFQARDTEQWFLDGVVD